MTHLRVAHNCALGHSITSVIQDNWGQHPIKSSTKLDSLSLHPSCILTFSLLLDMCSASSSTGFVFVHLWGEAVQVIVYRTSIFIRVPSGTPVNTIWPNSVTPVVKNIHIRTEKHTHTHTHRNAHKDDVKAATSHTNFLTGFLYFLRWIRMTCSHVGKSKDLLFTLSIGNVNNELNNQLLN